MTDLAFEFSRPYRVDQIPAAGLVVDLVATPQECADLAHRFDLRGISSLSAHVRLKAMGGGSLYRLDGELWADVVQTCVVSLEPVPAHVHETFVLTFSETQDEADSSEIDLYMDEADPPDPLIDGTIDVGEAVAEHLALGLDPFPRHPDAVFTEVDEPVEEPEKPNPFAVLVKLQKNKA